MTFYLKYRPQKISELDLPDVRISLTNILSARELPHAFLFAGPRGAGKTSAARILAKAINCEKKEADSRDVEPCNGCGTCLAISNGSCLDVIEIDAASNRGIDDIRTLREGVKLAPASARYKVYIIDEAHMLTTEASNALLKTLEEPPKHVVFILATTAPGKLLDTIRSRCTTLVFKKGQTEDIVRSLKKAVTAEKLKVEDGVLEEIAGGVDGSFREAHKILEQVSLGRGKVSLEDARRDLSVVGLFPEKLVQFLAAQDTSGAIGEIGRVVSSGADIRAYAVSLVSILRDILLYEFEIGEGVGVSASDLGGIDRVRAALEIFSAAAQAIPAAVIPQLPLELGIVEWVEDDEKGPQSNRLSGNSASIGNDSSAARSAKSSDSLSKESASNTPDGRNLTVGPSSGVERRNVLGGAPKVPAVPLVEEENGGEALSANWREIMKRVKPQNHSIEALLRATKPQHFTGDKLTIEVFYQFHKERIEKDPYRGLVENVASEVLGKPVRLVCLLSDSKQKAQDFSNISEGVEDDIVRAAEEIFGMTERKLPN